MGREPEEAAKSMLQKTSYLRHLRDVKGRLPLSESLEVNIHDPLCSLDLLDVVGGDVLPTAAEAHFGQLNTFGCLGRTATQVPLAVCMMPRMPHSLTFRLEFFISN